MVPPMSSDSSVYDALEVLEGLNAYKCVELLFEKIWQKMYHKLTITNNK